MKSAKSPSATASAAEIRNIIGPSDAELVTSIQSAGASTQEVLEAFQWLEGEDPGKTARKKMSATVSRVYDILLEERDRIEGPDDR